MLWQLLPGDVIGRQADEAVPMTSEEWRATKTQFAIKTERTWPNLEPSETAKKKKHEGIRLEGVLADLHGTQTRLQRGHTCTYACATKISVLQRYGSDGQN